MIDDPIAVTIGGEVIRVPVMPLYCLERAWPHIRRLGELGALTEAVRKAGDAATLATASAAALAGGADFIGQTHVALDIIVAALALSASPPTYDDLAKRLMPGEVAGVHSACNALMQASGLLAEGDVPGEARAAAERAIPSSNGIASLPN